MSQADLWGLVRLGIGSVTSKDGLADAIGGTPGPAGSTKGQEQTARYYPWGYDSRAPAGGKRACIAPSGGSQLVQVGERNDKAKPDYDDDKWTTILHNEVQGTWVKLRSDGGVQVAGKGSLFELKTNGDIKIANKNGATIELVGGVLRFNGGNTPANRRGDPVSAATSMAAWIASVSTATMVSPPTDFGTTAGGNTNVTMP